MCLLFETIKLDEGKFFNLHYHNLRLNAARAELFEVTEPIMLEDYLTVPENCKKGLFRCRVSYNRSGITKIEFIAQKPRKLSKLKIVHRDEIDYHLKYADRDILNSLFALRDDADEVIIIKKGMVTDCTIGNLVFWNGQYWHTPDTPLLNGTQRQFLLGEKLIHEKRITQEDIHNYSQCGIINAFFNLQNMPVLSTKEIYH